MPPIKASAVAVVIPAFNEAATIAAVVAGARARIDNVIVVDDGSIDATGTRAVAAGARVLTHAGNRGKAAALRTGFDDALARGARAVVTLDADGQHDPGHIPGLLAAASRRPDTLVVGARRERRCNAPWIRYAANCTADFWISWAAGRRIVDSQSGYRLYPQALLRDCVLPAERRYGFVYESEILIEAARRGYAVTAVAVDVCYPPAARKSHFRPVVDVCRIVRMVFWKIAAKGLWPSKAILPCSARSPAFVARRTAQAMAVALVKRCNAVHGRRRPRPSID